MSELLDNISNSQSADNKGTDIMANGDTITLTIGEYKCSDGTCAGGGDMLATDDLHGTIRCLNDDASCILNGESSRRGISVSGTGSGKLTIRAIRFRKGKTEYSGGGVAIEDGAEVDFAFCVFDSCEALSGMYGGGGISVLSGSTVVNIYATTFTGNRARGGGQDVYNYGGSMAIHDTCPPPYSANTPRRGEEI